MNALKKMQEASPSKEYRGFNKLKIGYHQINCFRIVKTKFGKTILVELDNEVLFLPPYFVENMGEEDIAELNLTINDENIYLYFGGRREQSR